jgi:CBS domain-containing protein
MKSVRQLLAGKGGAVFQVAPDATVFDAIKMMAEKSVGALLVLDHGRLAGIISERDYARKVILHGKSSHEVKVNEIMTTQVETVSPEDSTEDCMAAMTAKHIRHLPVIEGDKVIGVLSIGDLVKEVIAEQQQTIQQLESYIHS